MRINYFTFIILESGRLKCSVLASTKLRKLSKVRIARRVEIRQNYEVKSSLRGALIEDYAILMQLALLLGRTWIFRVCTFFSVS